MEKVYKFKPNSIFDVASENIFFELGIPEHDEYLKCGNHYELYYAISKMYDPTSILEIGTRNGYSLYSMMLPPKTLRRVDGYDINLEYIEKSIESLTPVAEDKKIHLNLQVRDTQKINELSTEYFLINIDGDSSFEGTFHDLNLTKKKSKVVLVSNFYEIREVRSATQRFVYDNSDLIKKSYIVDSLRGIYVIEYKC
jgi:hypothetical protein